MSKELFESLSKLCKENPGFEKALETLCDACLMNPACLMNVTTLVGKFAFQVAKSYLELGIRQAQHSQSR